METEKTKQNEEIEETSTTNTTEKSSSPNPGTVKTSEPEIQVHLFRRGKGPIDIFTSSLGGWDQNQLEVRDILEKYGFKSVFAFNRESGRGVPIRFNPRNGRSILPYKSGSVIFIDGEPKDSIIKPVTKILVGVAVITLLITLVFKETPGWVNKLNFFGGTFPPWIIACAVVVFTRMRKRTGDVLRKYGW